MGFFDKILGSKSEGATGESSKPSWIQLTNIAQLDEAAEASKTEKVIIFKHSTRCSISAAVLNKFERKIEEGYKLYYLDLIAHREISSAIADKFNVVHQSPQAILLENGKVTQQDSHYGILDLTL